MAGDGAWWLEVVVMAAVVVAGGGGGRIWWWLWAEVVAVTGGCHLPNMVVADGGGIGDGGSDSFKEGYDSGIDRLPQRRWLALLPVVVAPYASPSGYLVASIDFHSDGWPPLLRQRWIQYHLLVAFLGFRVDKRMNEVDLLSQVLGFQWSRILQKFRV
ncbi:predicted protein [Arabidopsis lyrata subsp. lyrata]|uniref:Predicted protein n=1 Tax=Arabidopsis lyrata subsp. lyrata TaxID=81972 RepID=D7LNJ5_ARALL|nr:predicted protein [Arabidopsis lyrata subsp. lyrata]